MNIINKSYLFALIGLLRSDYQLSFSDLIGESRSISSTKFVNFWIARSSRTMTKRAFCNSILFIIICFSLIPCFASEGFYAKVTLDNINVRSDSSISSQVICTAGKSDVVEVVSEKYDWYKIKLPRSAPAFVKKELIVPIDVKTAKAIKDSINIRLQPNESSIVLGKIGKNEIVNILEDKDGWYRIEPTDNSFGWIHKKFVEKTADKVIPEKIISASVLAPVDLPAVQDTLFEGVIQPYGKVINRIATHKLITKDYDIFLLKGNTDNLNTLTYHRVKVTGKLLSSQKQKYPVIEVAKMEALD